VSTIQNTQFTVEIQRQ